MSELGKKLPRRSPAGATAIPPITDAKADVRRGRDGPLSDHALQQGRGGSRPRCARRSLQVFNRPPATPRLPPSVTWSIIATSRRSGAARARRLGLSRSTMVPLHREGRHRASARLFLLRGRARSALGGEAADQGRSTTAGGQLRQTARAVARKGRAYWIATILFSFSGAHTLSLPNTSHVHPIRPGSP
jgi:hypothetical protein